MFASAHSFNPDSLNEWDTSSVTSMRNMFGYSYGFNSDISGWDISGVTDFRDMFAWARVFDSDMTKWTVKEGALTQSWFSNACELDEDNLPLMGKVQKKMAKFGQGC